MPATYKKIKQTFHDMSKTFVHPEMRLTKWTPKIPRDFYNVGKLCKCMGLLSLKELDCELPEGITIVTEQQYEPFEFGITNSGYFFVANYPVTINGKPVFFATVINNRDEFPLVCFIDNEEIRVFDESGEFTDEFSDIKI